MKPIKIMFTAAMMMLWAILLACMDSGNYEFASLLAMAASVVFIVGLLVGPNDKPIPDDRLPQRSCPKCGKKHDFDFPKCPHCGHDYQQN